MLDNRSKDSYLLLHWQDRMSEEESTPGELEGEAERGIMKISIKGSFSVTGEYDIPILEPVEYKYCDWIGFNYASSVKDRRGKGIHFF